MYIVQLAYVKVANKRWITEYISFGIISEKWEFPNSDNIVRIFTFFIFIYTRKIHITYHILFLVHRLFATFYVEKNLFYVFLKKQ